MAKNELLPFADGEDANVLPTNQWEALTDILENGFQSGIAKSEQVNRVLAQGAVASYVLGQLIVEQLNKDATLDKNVLYQNLILALQENAKDACLPLSGGTMTGAIRFTGSESICRTDDNTGLSIYGGTGANNGAYLQAFGKNSSGNEGIFNLVASNGTNVYALRGNPNGTLTWAGLDVERVNSKGSNWIRYENGLQICWEYLTASDNGGIHFVFPVPFANAYYSISAIIAGSADRNWSVLYNSNSTAGVNVWVKNNGGAGTNQGLTATIIGWWK